MILAFDSEEPWALWAPAHGVSEMAWSPDGRRMAFVAAETENRLVVGAETKGRTVTARRITRADWRWNEVGHRDRWDQVWVGPVRRGTKPRQHTRHDTNARSIAWAPDGRSIAYVTEAGPDADIRPLPSIWVVPAAGGPPREAVRLAGYAGSPAFSPDGRWLACSGVDVPDPLDDEIPGLFVAPFHPDADGPSPAIPVAPDLDLPIGDWNDTDLNGWMASSRPGPTWDGPGALVALVSTAGRVQPWRFGWDPDAGRSVGAPSRLTDAEIAAVTLGVAGGVVSLVATLDDRPMELLTVAAPGPVGGPGPRAVGGRRPGPAQHHPWRRLAARLPVAGDAARRGARARRTRSRPGSSRPRAPRTSPCQRSSTSTGVRSGPGPRHPRWRTSFSRRAATGSSCRTSGVGPATGRHGSRPSSATSAASTPTTSSRRSTMSSTSGWPTRRGWGSSGSRTAGSWSTG